MIFHKLTDEKVTTEKIEDAPTDIMVEVIAGENMNSLRAIFDEDSELNKEMRKQAERFEQKSIEERSCYSCRYAQHIDDGQGYGHYECRLRKKKTDILTVDKDCVFFRTKGDFKILDYDRKAILDVFLEKLDEEIEDFETNAREKYAPEERAKYEILAKHTEEIKRLLLWLMGN